MPTSPIWKILYSLNVVAALLHIIADIPIVPIYVSIMRTVNIIGCVVFGYALQK